MSNIVDRFIFNPSEEDARIAWGGEDTVFKAESVTTLQFPADEADGMVEHFVKNGVGFGLKEVSADEAQELTSGKIGKKAPKVAKVKGGKEAEGKEE